MAEGWVGTAKHCSNFIAMVVSTGVGGGIVLNGTLLDGADGNAGHIGHVFVDPKGGRTLMGFQAFWKGLLLDLHFIELWDFRQLMQMMKRGKE